MNCVIYKGSKKADHYLYVECEDDFDRVPQHLRELLGELSLVMNIELNEKRRLVQADVKKVMQSLTEQGYYFQVPPRPEIHGREYPSRSLR